MYFGVDDRTGRVTGVSFPSGDSGRSAWNKWALAAGTALRRCHECGGGKNEDFRVFASRSIAPSQYEMVRIPVKCEGSEPQTYVVRANDGKAAGPPPIGHELYVVEVRVQSAANWDRALVGDCTTWLVKQQHRPAAGEHCDYVRWVRLDKQTVAESTLSLSSACALCSVPEPKPRQSAGSSSRKLLSIGEQVEACFAQDSTPWKPAAVAAKQPETDNFVLPFDGYTDETAGVPRLRIRPIVSARQAATTVQVAGVISGSASEDSSNGARVCAQCCEAKPRTGYSFNQWTKKDAGFSRCVICCAKEQARGLRHSSAEQSDNGGSTAFTRGSVPSELARACATCAGTKQECEFSRNQWGKGDTARCKACVASVGVASRQCAACGNARSRPAFSPSQWRKGSGISRCDACVGGVLRPTKRATSGQQER